jgi:transcriptional repressor NrdR
MDCPYCISTESRVTNKRGCPQGIRRRRECLGCKKRFTTYERICQEDLFVIKKDGTRQRFDREKLLRGIDRAFEKRPVSQEKIQSVVDEIESSLRKKGVKEIKTSVVGEMVMRKIKKIDNVAYIRFASVYRDFKDIDDFKEELQEINKKSK